MKTIPFKGRLLLLGCGSVSQCTLPLLLRHVKMPAKSITVLDMVDGRPAIADALARGVNYVQARITPENYRHLLAEYVGPGDMIVDLTWNIDTCSMLEWCHEHDVRYVNTSVELWDPYVNIDKKSLTELTLYHRQMNLRRMVERWGGNSGATAIVDHGANPGLVSHFTKLGLLDIGRRILSDKPRDRRAAAIELAMADQSFNRLAQLAGVKVIHVSERDTQISNRPKQVNEFVNTWSVEGLYEEGTAPAEMGWGTHETEVIPGAKMHTSGPRNQICLATFGMNTWVRSWVPSGEIIGMVIRHGEAFSISDYLTVFDRHGAPVYRPTVHYAYCPSDAAIASLHEVRMHNYRLQEQQRIMTGDIIAGHDELGCLLMGHDFNSWWMGSVLTIDQARPLVPGQNATTLQVAASVLGAVFWMIRNARQGFNLPDHLPHEEILDVARPYLGQLISQSVDWMPTEYRDTVAAQALRRGDEPRDPWQFSNFLITPMTRRSRPRAARTPERRRVLQ